MSDTPSKPPFFATEPRDDGSVVLRFLSTEDNPAAERDTSKKPLSLFILPDRYDELAAAIGKLAGRDVSLTGKAPAEAYLAAGYWAVRAGVRSLVYTDKTGKDPVSLPVARDAAETREEKRWLRLEVGEGGDSVATIVPSTRSGSGGKWTPNELRLDVPVALPPGISLLRATGWGRMAMYANIGCSAALAGVPEVLVRKPQAPYDIRIGADGKSGSRARAGSKRGIVVGILGDPNSGKSVFARALDVAIARVRPAWAENWIYDCDTASPTPDWYREACQSGNPDIEESAAAARDAGKTEWTPETQRRCADDLATLRTNLDLVIADLPGGRHKDKEGRKLARPLRIPDEYRAGMMRQCDAFVVLCREDRAARIFEGWRTALAEHGLSDRIVARIISADPDSPFSATGFFQREDGLVLGTVRGLDRHNPTGKLGAVLAEGAGPLLRLFFALGPVREARPAAALAFLTADKGTRYGAAARSASSGRIFRAGQYSSFNHSTNIHAEMGALARAAAEGEPDVDVLAVAWTGDGLATPCGVCRQVMAEHARRTGRNFDVAMVPSSGPPVVRRVSELLPFVWEARGGRAGRDAADARDGREVGARFSETSARMGGEFVEPAPKTGSGRLVGLVWDEAFAPAVALAKIKYAERPDGLWDKLPHAFTEAAAYRRELADLRRAAPGLPGLATVPANVGEKSKVRFRNPVPLPRAEAELFGRELFAPAGIDAGAGVLLTGSRALGMDRPGSDWDLVVQASPEAVAALHARVAELVAAGKAAVPEESGSVRLLRTSFPGGVDRLLAEGRWADTFALSGRRVSLLFVTAGNPGPAFPAMPRPAGRECVCGRIEDASGAPFKRSESLLRAENGRLLRLLCYHKLGNLLKAGDRVVASGLICRGSGGVPDTLLLANLFTDKLVWLP